MKYILALILVAIVIVLSYIIFMPYLLMSFRFKDHHDATMNACIELADWVGN